MVCVRTEGWGAEQRRLRSIFELMSSNRRKNIVQTVMICTLHHIFIIQGQSMKEDEMSYVCRTSGREGNACRINQKIRKEKTILKNWS